MIKYNYIVVASFRGVNSDTIVAYCETENEAITKMEEIEHYKTNARVGSAYAEINGIAIYKIERITI